RPSRPAPARLVDTGKWRLLESPSGDSSNFRNLGQGISEIKARARAENPLARFNVWAKLGATKDATRSGRLSGWYPGGNDFPPVRLYLQPVLEQAAHENGLPADLVLAQAWAESSWRVDAVSGIGALGVLQLTPDTVDFVSKNLLHLDHDLDVLDPAANARMGTVYLKHLLEHTDGDL